MTGGADHAATTGRPIELRISRRWIALGGLLVLATLVRFWAMRWPPFPYDMNTWIAWGERLRDVGPNDFYAEGYFANYTPGYMYVLWLIAVVKHAFFASAGLGTYYFLHRLPALICDLAIGVVIFRLMERIVARGGYQDTTADADAWPVFPGAIAALWLFNPAVILNSAVWGQVDSVSALGMLLTIVFLLDRRSEAAMATYAVTVLIKPHAIVIAPVAGLALLLWFPRAQIIRSLAIGVVVGVVLLLPFYGLRFIPDLWDLLTSSTDGFEYSSMNLYNLWGIYGFWRDDRLSLFGPISARGFGAGLFVLGLAYGLALLWRELKRGTDRTFTLFLFSAYFSFMPVMLLTLMRERYLYAVFPFLLVFAALCYLRDGDPRPEDAPPRFLLAPMILYLVLTLLHTMNLYQVYQFYVNFESGGVPITNTLYYRIADNAKVWSVLSLLCLTAFVVLMPSWLASAEPVGEQRKAESSGDAVTAPEPA